MSEEEIKQLLKVVKDPREIEYLKWTLNGDGFYSSAQQNSVYY